MSQKTARWVANSVDPDKAKIAYGAYTDTKSSDQPLHLYNLLKAFIFCLQDCKYRLYRYIATSYIRLYNSTGWSGSLLFAHHKNIPI